MSYYKLIFVSGKVEDRPIHSPSLYFSYNPDQESVNQLQIMFPNIPRAYVVRELDRCDGSVESAVDKLVLMAPDFMGFRGEDNGNGSAGQVDTSPASTSAPSTHHNLLNSLNESNESKTVTLDGDPSITLTKKNWDKVGVERRQQILMEKKREMLIKARESFCKKSE